MLTFTLVKGPFLVGTDSGTGTLPCPKRQGPPPNLALSTTFLAPSFLKVLISLAASLLNSLATATWVDKTLGTAASSSSKSRPRAFQPPPMRSAISPSLFLVLRASPSLVVRFLRMLFCCCDMDDISVAATAEYSCMIA